MPKTGRTTNVIHKFRRLAAWSWRAWPALVTLAILFLHLLLVPFFQLDCRATNRLVSLITQLAGGLLILYSIDSNIGVFKHKTLIHVFIEYLKQCPLVTRSVSVGAANVIAVAGMSAVGKASARRSPTTIEEEMQYLREEVAELRRDLTQQGKDINEKIDRGLQDIRARVQDTENLVRRTASTFEEVTIGGFQMQLFGILLMVYGAFAGYLS